MKPSRAAGVALVLALLAACQPAPAPVAVTPSAVPFVGALSATASRLETITATPSPFLAASVEATRGTITRIVGHQATRTFEIRIADHQPLAAGNVYSVGSPDSLDPKGLRTGASIVLADGNHSWISTSGTLTVSLVAGTEVACYFQGVGMAPSPDPAAGSFQVDGQVQAPLPASN